MLVLKQVKQEFHFACKDIPHATHQPVLYTLGQQGRNLKILEFGCGMFSTGLLSYLNRELGHDITTFDNDITWLNKIRHELKYPILPTHKLVYVEDWKRFFETTDIHSGFYDIIFIDQAPWEARELTLSILSHRAKYIVIHDSDFYPGYNIDYNAYLKHYKVYMPAEPYPYPSGPPTLLGSNYTDDLPDIDYKDFT